MLALVLVLLVLVLVLAAACIYKYIYRIALSINAAPGSGLTRGLQQARLAFLNADIYI